MNHLEEAKAYLSFWCDNEPKSLDSAEKAKIQSLISIAESLEKIATCQDYRIREDYNIPYPEEDK